MIETSYILKIDHYYRLVLKRRWFIIVPLALAVMGGIYLSITLPRVYSANTLILVEPQRVPEGFVQSLVSIDINSRISTISQQIMSRTNLEKIIKQFDLYSGPENKKMFMEDKVDGLRKRISVNVTQARGGTDAFSISFKGKEPEKVMRIANTLATYFIDENLKVREAQAIGTSSFLDDELLVMRKKLESVEEALNTYRKRHMGELPEQLETNLRMLDRLQLELNEKEESLRNARNRLADVENMIQSMEDQSEFAGPAERVEHGEGTGTEDAPSEEESQLLQLKQQLAMMQTRYTARHPDIGKLKRVIAGLETKLSMEKKAVPETPPTGVPDSAEAAGPENRVDTQTLNQKDSILREIGTLNVEMAELRKEIAIFDERVENTPKREQELLSLNRDYGNIQSQYNSLLGRKLEAEIAVNMERKQKGEQFRILDPARKPEKPSEPDMKKLFLFTIAVGLGAGGGLVFLLDFFDTSFKDIKDVESVLGMPILAMVPSIVDPKELKRRRIRTVVSLFSLMIVLILFAGFATLTFKGVDQTMAFVGKFIKV